MVVIVGKDLTRFYKNINRQPSKFKNLEDGLPITCINVQPLKSFISEGNSFDNLFMQILNRQDLVFSVELHLGLIP